MEKSARGGHRAAPCARPVRLGWTCSWKSAGREVLGAWRGAMSERIVELEGQVQSEKLAEAKARIENAAALELLRQK